MQEKHLAVISHQLCNRLYNADLLGVEGGRELKTFSVSNSIPSFPFMELRRRKSPPPTPSDGEFKSWDDVPPRALPGEPQEPSTGLLPFHSSQLLTTHQHLQD